MPHLSRMFPFCLARTLLGNGLAPAAMAAPARRAPATSAQREPTEVEMRTAVENILQGARANADRMSQSCNERTDNPLIALQCLAGAGMSGATRGVRINNFEKLNCGAATTGGYWCDYLIQLDMGQFNVMGLDQPQTGQKRFVRTKYGWLVFDQ